MKLDYRSNPSRRAVLSLMAAAGAAMIAPESLFADELDPRVNKILTKYASVDMHSHVTVVMVPEGESDPKKDPTINFAAEQKHSGFAVLCFAYHVDTIRKTVKPGQYYNAHIQALNQMDRMLERENMKRVFNLKQLEAAHKSGQPVIIQNSEGAQWIEGHLDRVEESYKRGMRHLQLVHESDDLVSPLGDIQTEPAVGGLTAFGKEVVKECNRLHMVMDFAHGGFEMVKGALAITTQPFVVSHTALDSPATRAARAAQGKDSRRLVSPEYAKAVAANGGIIGIWHLFPTAKDWVGAVKEMVDVIGVDHVGIGTDTYLGGRGLPTNSIYPDQHVGYMFLVADEMLKQGFHPDEVGKIAGGNYCKLFGKVMGDRT